MENGYRILWTDHALDELSDTYDYLEKHFTEREMRKLSIELDKILTLISRKPKLFALSKFVGLRRVVVKKHNTLYYRVNLDYVEIISFFSNRQEQPFSK